MTRDTAPADLEQGAVFTPEAIAAAHVETERLSRELDIKNADHVALWLEANLGDASLGWLAVRIVEAHEAAFRDAARGAEGSLREAVQREIELLRGADSSWATGIRKRLAAALEATPQPGSGSGEARDA